MSELLDTLIHTTTFRELYNEKEIRDMVTELAEQGISQPEITDIVLLKASERTYTSSMVVMDMLLDIRNLYSVFEELLVEQQVVPEMEGALV